MNTIDNFNIVKVDKSFSKSHLSLSCWLTETTGCHTWAIWISTAVCSSAINTLAIASSLASDRSTPNYITSVIVNWNANVFGITSHQFEVFIGRIWILKETLADTTSYYAFWSSVAICITPTLCVCLLLVQSRTTSKTKPNWLRAKVLKCHYSLPINCCTRDKCHCKWILHN